MTHSRPGTIRATHGRARIWPRVLAGVGIVLIWLVLAGIGGPTFGKLSSVSDNDPAAFLPSSAEATEAREAQGEFLGTDSIPAIVVVSAHGALDDADRDALTRFAAAAERVDGVDGAVVGPVPSADGLAAQFIVPIGSDETIKTVVAELRAALAEAVEGTALTGHVTGGAGFSADLSDAFGGIDGILLAVALGAVFVILLLVYRSVILPFAVLLTSVFALCAAILVVYLLAAADVIALNGQSQGILSILVIGATTDYALLFVSRFRDEIAEGSDRSAAIRGAWRGAVEPIVASGATVAVALLCLLFSDLSSNRALGPIGAAGIVCAVLAALSFLPAVLFLLGRVAFWPVGPRTTGENAAVTVETGLEGQRGLWRRVGTVVSRRPRVVWVSCVLLLAVACLGLGQLRADGVPQSELVLGGSDAAAGETMLGEHFDAGAGSPVYIVVDESSADEVSAAVADQPDISTVTAIADGGGPAVGGQPPLVVDGRVLLSATLTVEPDSERAEEQIVQIRDAVHAIQPDTVVGGSTAIAYDTNVTAQRDLVTIIPIVLVVILVILMLLLRSVVAPVLLMATVVLSYAATMGVSAIVFTNVIGFSGADATVPLFGFVFLVALGVDYNIFLMTRVREESALHGTRPGILRGLSITGGVITSAGLVLAATFAALSVIPIMFLVQLSFIVAFGVLLDTVLVRSLLVPALGYDLGRVIWWPARLGREPQRPRVR
ncbi:MMPL family transporter [Mycetocola reblochoni]|nr:MMPL family transporter [Mycetocola reblochoni]